ncbi:unnamed protein product [Arctia plantaginis]|uniref:Uncharacterized protein n=1 Tax=Arctia plantaginis TaxID=874455 RepID=A0A8S1B6H3_ARCPL|nr:unnamed protein product [Arctia plantaginis]
MLMVETENVTIRRARAHSDTNQDDSVNSHTLDGTMHSVPGISEDEDVDIINELREQIDGLTTKLLSANNQIDSLILENKALKKMTII